MEKEMLYDFLTDSYVGAQFYNLTDLRDFAFNKQIGFDCCYQIQKDIKENISKNIYEFNINYCSFINKVIIKLESTINSNPESFYCDSILERVDNNTIVIKLIDRDWHNHKDWFIYNIIRFSLYIVYYKYLKKFDTENKFIKFVNFLSRIKFCSPEINKNITLEKYIDSLKETECKLINEQIFYDALNAYYKWQQNEMKFNLYIS